MASKDSASDRSPEQLELERRVDQMMDLNLPDPPAPRPAEPASAPASSSKRIDIFSDVKTAPDVAPNLLKSLGLKEKPEKEKPAPDPPAPAVSETPPHHHRTHHKTDPAKPKPHKQPSVDEAVDDIVLAESDKLLALQDAADRSKRVARDRRYKRVAVILLLVVIVLAIIAYPAHLI